MISPEHAKYLFSVERMNTAEIARGHGCSEAEVYNAIYSIEEPSRRQECATRIREIEDAVCAVTSRFIIADTAEKHGLSVDAIKSRRRETVIVEARQEAFARLRSERNLTLSQIARIMGGWDHSTVLYGIRAHQARMAWMEARKA